MCKARREKKGRAGAKECKGNNNKLKRGHKKLRSNKKGKDVKVCVNECLQPANEITHLPENIKE